MDTRLVVMATPILNKAHDAATNNGAAIISKRVSINDNPFKNILISYSLYYIQFLQIDTIENLSRLKSKIKNKKN